jgi:methylase of polypeptide subunit release factors
VTVDLGCGDGRAVLAAAAGRPDRLVVGVDASAAAMAEASRRADRKPGRGYPWPAAARWSLTQAPSRPR